MNNPDQILEPFPGPRPFTSEERHLFYGRSEEQNDLRDLINNYPLVLLYSQSGAGKSSLLQAGLRPQLAGDGIATIVTRVNQRIDPAKTRMYRNIYTFCAASGHFGRIEDPDDDLSHYFANRSKKRHLVVLDQFEEIFTAFPDRWQDRKSFFLQLAAALELDSELRVLLIMREEYISQLQPYSDMLPFGLQMRYRLERLREDGALVAIVEPLKAFGYEINPEEASRLLHNLKTIRVKDGNSVREIPGEFIEPVQLQVVCQDLWNKRDRGKRTIVVPEMLGGVDQALEDFYNRGIKHTCYETKLSETLIREWFARSVITSAGTRRVLFKDQTRTEQLDNRAVAVLEDQHILRSEPRGTEQTVELTHDRLIGPILSSNRTYRNARRKILYPRYGAAILFVLLSLGWLAHYFDIRLQVTRHKELRESVERDVSAGDSDLHYAQRLDEGRDDVKAAKYYQNAFDHFKNAVPNFSNTDFRGDRAGDVFLSLAEVSKHGSKLRQDSEKLLQDALNSEPDQKALGDANAAHNWDLPALAQLLVALGEIRYREGKTKDALMDLNFAQSLGSLSTNSSWSRLYEDIGLAYLRMGQFDQAYNYILLALNSAGIGDDFGPRFNLLFDLGLIANGKGDYLKAKRFFEGLALEPRFKSENGVHDPSRLLREEASAYLGIGKEPFAKSRVDAALNNRSATKYDRGLAYVTLSEFYNERKRPDTNKALSAAAQAITILKSLDDGTSLGMAWAYKARAHSLQGLDGKNDTQDQTCKNKELDCSLAEVQEAKKNWEGAEFVTGNAYNETTLGLIADAHGDSEGATRHFTNSFCSYEKIGAAAVYRKGVEFHIHAAHRLIDARACEPRLAQDLGH